MTHPTLPEKIVWCLTHQNGEPNLEETEIMQDPDNYYYEGGNWQCRIEGEWSPGGKCVPILATVMKRH
jgi:hypothetical protein